MKEQYTLVADKKQYGLLNPEPVIRTYTGKWVNVFDPKPEMFDIEDIAHALSMQCRFGGHLSQLYTVAQHSIQCYELATTRGLSSGQRLTALMHDASEAYLVDIPRPIKREFGQYKIIEDKLMTTLAGIFHFNWPLAEEIHDIDNAMLQVEWNNLMLKDNRKPGSITWKLHVMSNTYAKELFLEIFNDLTK